MLRAIALARQTSLVHKAGGPFGCVIVKDGDVVAEGANTVLADCDPTCHAEINAIREACKEFGTHDLTGCILYASGEPCPMCYAACCWARIEKIYFASTMYDAKKYGGFDDEPIMRSFELDIKDRKISGTQFPKEEMIALWKEFSIVEDRLHY